MSQKIGKGVILFKEKQSPSQILSQRSRESRKSKDKNSDTALILILETKEKKVEICFAMKEIKNVKAREP